jgi:DNA-binding transcriptional regulator YiaG
MGALNAISPKPLTADDLRQFRAEMGWSQMRFAKALGVSRRAVEYWESGRSPSPTYLRLALATLAAGLEAWRG